MFRPFAAVRTLLLCLACAGSGSIHSQAQLADTDVKLEHATFDLINEYRASEQLPPLTWNAEIARVARAHSRDMALGTVSFGHAGFSSRVSHLRNELPGLMGCGENVLMTGDPNDAARSAVALWLKSPPHLRNIRGNFKLSGLGIWINSDGVLYFTQIFVKSENSAGSSEAD